MLFGFERGFWRDFVNTGKEGGGKIGECVRTYTVVCYFTIVSDNFEWAYTSVYGPKDDNDR